MGTDGTGTAAEPAQADDAVNDADAPWGYKQDGTPKSGPGGRPPGTRTTRFGRGKKEPRKATPPRRRATPNPAPAASAKRATVDYSGTVTEIVMSLGGIVALGSPLDGAVLIDTAPEWGELGNELAQVNEYVRRACDRAMTVGPWGRVTALVLKVGAQIAENHQWLPHTYTRAFGAKPRQVFAREFDARVNAMAAQWAAAQDPSAPYPDGSNGVPFERREPHGAAV